MNKFNFLLLTLIFISCGNSETESQLARENNFLKKKLEEKGFIDLLIKEPDRKFNFIFSAF